MTENFDEKNKPEVTFTTCKKNHKRDEAGEEETVNHDRAGAVHRQIVRVVAVVAVLWSLQNGDAFVAEKYR